MAALNHSSAALDSPGRCHLFQLFLFYKNHKSSRSLDPDLIRKELYDKEKSRILSKRVVQPGRLFHFAETSSFDIQEFDDEERRFRGMQQDAKDFFICLEENKEHFQDVFDLFKYTPIEYTVCRHCGEESRGGSEVTKCEIFLSLPAQGMTMAQHISQHFNGSTVVPDWRHEDGGDECRHKRQDADKFFKIKDFNEVQFLVIVVDRLQRVDGELSLMQTDVPVGGSVKVTGFNGAPAILEPIAVIHHQGQAQNNETFGHYQADILHPQKQQWFQTSDDSKPMTISHPSSKGYIFIYRRT